MSRPQLSTKQRQRVFSDFISAAWEMIQAKGVQSLTLRKVSAAAGYNSATLYQHFHDLDELTAYASLRYLLDYDLTLPAFVKGMTDPLQLLYTVWEQFCRMAFQSPKALSILFFGTYSADLDQMIAKYCDAFPQQRVRLEGETVAARLFQYGSLEARSMSLLRPLAEAGLLNPDQLDAQNEIILYCFKELLSQKCRHGNVLDSERLIRRQREYIGLVLGCNYTPTQPAASAHYYFP